MANSVQLEIIGEVSDPSDQNTDVFIRFENGEEYVASFFTIKNIVRMMSKNKVSGEQQNGSYFWSSDMVIVEEISEDCIRRTVEDLIKSQGFFRAASATNELARKRIEKETGHIPVGQVLTRPIKVIPKNDI